MRKILLMILVQLFISLYAHSAEESHNNPEMNINSSFLELWKGNFGDVLDFGEFDGTGLTDEAIEFLLERLEETNKVLIDQNSPYYQKRGEVRKRISFLKDQLPALREELFRQYRERNLLLIRKSMAEDNMSFIEDININRSVIYDTENKISHMETEIIMQNRKLGSVKKFLAFNNILIRRNNMRIAMLGGGTIKAAGIERAEMIPAAIIAPPEDKPIPLMDPDTLSHYSMAAMDGFKLDRCPKHDHILDYSFRLVEDTYRNVSYSYPLYAGWCDESNTAFLFREEEDTSKTVVIEIRNRKKAIIDDMLKKSRA